MANLAKHVFYNFLDVFFSKFVNIHAKDALPIDDLPYKSMFNDSCSAIFFKSFDDFILMPNENYLLLIVLPYSVSLSLSRFNVQTNVKFNLFKSIKSISHSDPNSKMLFKSCNDMCEMTYCIRAKLKKRCNAFYFLIVIFFR